MRRTSILAVVLCVQFACASLALAGQGRSVVAYPTPAQEVTYDQGTAFVTSRGQSTVILSAQPLSKSRAWISLSVINNSEEALTVVDSMVGARDRTGSAPVIHADAIVAAERKKQFWESLGTELAAGINTYTANQQGRYSESGTFSGRVGSYGSRERITGTYTATGTDAAARQVAIAETNRKNEAMMEELKVEHQARLGSLSAGLFKSQTIPAGGVYSGRLQIALPASVKGAPSLVVVEATIGSERHEFLVFVDGAPNTEQAAKVAALQPKQSLAFDVAGSELLPRTRDSRPPQPQVVPERAPAQPSSEVEESGARPLGSRGGLFRDAVFGASSTPVTTLKAKAERGEANAQFELARIYAAGSIVAADPAAALMWFRRAEAQGHAGAQLALGLIQLGGILGQKSDPAIALTYLQRAEEQSEPRIDLVLGLLYLSGAPVPDRDAAKGIELLRRAADRNYPPAEFWLGALYLDADSGLATDVDRAFGLIRRAAAEADATTLFLISAAYSDKAKIPRGVDRDVGYFLEKAENGEANAQFLMGSFHAAGVVLPADDKQSIAWFMRSAKQGNAAACAALGMYFKSKNDMLSAYTWLLVASRMGFPRASTLLLELEKGMSPQLISEATRRASSVHATPETSKR